jgi:ABC-2 type transport system permease protein
LPEVDIDMLKIYLQFKAQYLKTQMEYTVNFWMMAISGIIMRGLLMVVVFVLYRNIPDIAGWREGEVYLILGFIIISEGLHNIFFDGIWHIPMLVFRGGLDVMLCRPISTLYQIISYEIGLQGVGNVIIGLFSVGLGLTLMGWLTPLSIALCILFIFTGTILRMSYNIISLSNVFWIHGGMQTAAFMVHSVGELARYPITIYPGWLRFILLFVIPAGFIGYVPALIIRGEHIILYTVAVLVMTVLFFLLARFVFYRGVRRYESIGM